MALFRAYADRTSPRAGHRAGPPRVKSKQAGTSVKESNEKVRLASRKGPQSAESTRNSSPVTTRFWVAVSFSFLAGDRLTVEGVGRVEVVCVLGVGMSSGLGSVRVVWAHGQCGGSVVMRVMFGAQLPSSQLPAALCVSTISHVRRRPSSGSSLGYLTCVI